MVTSPFSFTQFSSRLLVGAPLGNNLQPHSNRSGALFKCPISTRDDDCIQVETDGKGMINCVSFVRIYEVRKHINVKSIIHTSTKNIVSV